MTGHCRGCGSARLSRVLDLGAVPAADHFPAVSDPVRAGEACHPLAMDLCLDCALAQLAEDDTVTSEPRGVEPQALRDQAADAVERVARAGLLDGRTVREFGSPHGGSWLPDLAQRGIRETAGPADIVLDCFGIMHEPDQRAAFDVRAAATAGDGVLLLQYHELSAIIRQGQWNALRHGHFAYYSAPAVTGLLAAAGMRVVASWRFDLYGGTVLVAARHGAGDADAAMAERVLAERDLGTPAAFAGLQQSADGDTAALRAWLRRQNTAGERVYAYGAASRAVALFARAGLDRGLLAAVADAAPAKQGRRMPGTDIEIISPSQLVEAAPGRVVLTLPDLLPEVSAQLPQLAGRWVTMDAVLADATG